MQGSKEGQNNTTIISLLCEAETLGQMLKETWEPYNQSISGCLTQECILKFL